MNAPTPGPWFVCADLTVRSRALAHSDQMGDYQGVIVADLKPALGWGGDTPWEVALAREVRPHAAGEAGANARLIAAAPDLLAAAERVAAKLAEYQADPAALYPEDLLALIGELLPPLVARAKGQP